MNYLHLMQIQQRKSKEAEGNYDEYEDVEQVKFELDDLEGKIKELFEKNKITKFEIEVQNSAFQKS